MFRFKLRTLLIATALVAVFLGLQVHVHMKAVRFVKEMRNKTGLEFQVDQSDVLPLSVSDLIFFQRSCETTGSVTERIGVGRFNFDLFEQTYRVRLIGNPEQLQYDTPE